MPPKQASQAVSRSADSFLGAVFAKREAIFLPFFSREMATFRIHNCSAGASLSGTCSRRTVRRNGIYYLEDVRWLRRVKKSGWGRL